MGGLTPLMTTALLQGAYDLHLHAAPDIGPRSGDFFQVARAYAEAGFAGILVKDHFMPSTDRAYAVNASQRDGFRVFGSVVLNTTVGGLNPRAVAVALARGAAAVFMPTSTARNHLERAGRPRPPFDAVPVLAEDDPGISILDARGRPDPRVIEICRLVAAKGAILATGHLSPRECVALATVAREMGVERLVATHASLYLSDLTVDQQRFIVSMGGVIEHSWFAVKHPRHPTSPRAIAEQIQQVGAEHCILTTDYGQVQVGRPVDGFVEMVETLMAHGISKRDMELMIRVNPARLVSAVSSRKGYAHEEGPAAPPYRSGSS